MAENRLQKTLNESRELSESNGVKLEAGNYPDLFIDNNLACYSIPYLRITNRVFSPTHNALMFNGEGYAFAIEGDNLRLLLRMMNLHRLAEIIEGQTYHFEAKDIVIKSITIQPLADIQDDE